MNVTRIEAAAPVGSPRHVAGLLREWAERVEAGDVVAYGLVMVHGADRLIHLGCRPIGEGNEPALVTLLAGARLLTDLAAEHVRTELMSETDAYDLPRGEA